LHHTLAASILHGRLLVATPWPDIEALIRRLGFTHHGQTRHDVYACGRQGQIFTQHFARDHLPRWLDGLSVAGLPAPLVREQHWLRAQVRQALEQLADPAALARSPLLALSAVTTVDGLREQLTDAVYTLAGSDTPLHVQAGQLLQNRYLRRRTGHDAVARRMHLSRATYFRRLEHGLDAVARLLFQSPEPPWAPMKACECQTCTGHL
jgi:hypothetical protein